MSSFGGPNVPPEVMHQIVQFLPSSHMVRLVGSCNDLRVLISPQLQKIQVNTTAIMASKRELEKFQQTLDSMASGIAGMASGIAGMSKKIDQLIEALHPSGEKSVFTKIDQLIEALHPSGEKIVFTAHCKLFSIRKVNGKWDDEDHSAPLLGMNEIKMSHDQTKGEYRILMESDKVPRKIADFDVKSVREVKFTTDLGQVYWTCTDKSNNPDGKEARFSSRWVNKELAKEFYEQLDFVRNPV